MIIIITPVTIQALLLATGNAWPLTQAYASYTLVCDSRAQNCHQILWIIDTFSTSEIHNLILKKSNHRKTFSIGEKTFMNHTVSFGSLCTDVPNQCCVVYVACACSLDYYKSKDCLICITSREFVCSIRPNKVDH